MPLYTYNCGACPARQTLFKKIADRDDLVRCQMCGGVSWRPVEAPRVVDDYAAYQCPISGREIRGRRAHEENLARTGCRVLESGESEAVRRRSASSDTALEDAIAETAAEFVETLPHEKRQALEVELSQGTDISVTRSTL